MRVLITGGAGYLGTEISLRLMQNSRIKSVRVYDNLSRKNYNLFLGPERFNEKLSFAEADLLDTYTLKKEVAKADLIIHLAAKASTPFADANPHFFDQINHWGTAELSYAFEEATAEKLIYMSSASVYGSGHEHVNTSTHPNPRTFYGISKLKGEQHLTRLSSKKKVSIVRCGNVYGYSKSMRFDSVINRFVFQAKNMKRVTINGSGEQTRSFVHIERVVDFIEQLVISNKTSELYNLVDQNLTVNDVAYTLKDIIPDMEMLYVDHPLKLREIKVSEDPHVIEFIGNKNKTLQEELEEFLEKMA
ncbi:MAG: SDR family oxidoreductase [Flavobacteriales bacterium]|nr:SDR family oxidoreductase [Flavobacteriales bacterium]